MEILCFSTIFENYEQFKEFTSQFSLYKAEDSFAEVINREIFYVLYNRYLGVQIAYDTPDEFLAEFGIAYQQYFIQYKAKKDALKEIYKLTAEDYEIVSESVSNFSNNPNSKQVDPFELLIYTTTQQRGRAKVGKLQAYINALRSLPDAQINMMIAKFDYLWLDLLYTENEYLY